MKVNMYSVLAACPLLAGIPADTVAAMLDCLQPKMSAYPKNSFIIVESQPFTGLGILLAGEAAVVKETMAGTRSVLTLLRAGHMFGEMVAFSAKKIWPASVVAQTHCSVVFLPPEKIIGICPRSCAGHQQLIRNMLGILSEKALLLNRKVDYLTIKSLRGKIATFLLEQGAIQGKTTFDLPLKRSDLADFLHVSRTALSRELGRMRDEGLFDFYLTSVKIQDREGLKKASE